MSTKSLSGRYMNIKVLRFYIMKLQAALNINTAQFINRIDFPFDGSIVNLYSPRSYNLTNSANRDRLNKFLQQVEKRAFRIVISYTYDHDEALDIVQDSMIKLVKSYPDKDEAELTPLFYRILYNTVKDWKRRSFIKNKFFSFFGILNSHDEYDPINMAKDSSQDVERNIINHQSLNEVEIAITYLPERQRQAFVLRIWQELDVKQTAKAMSCSEGSVKTHLSRALRSLKSSLGEATP